MRQAIIHLHPRAPSKPPTGQACNGCGACCALEPCPLGTVLSLRRSGSCSALEWDDAQGHYRCGLLVKAAATGAPARRLVSRWIAAGAGCDAELELAPAAQAGLETSAQSTADMPAQPVAVPAPIAPAREPASV